MSTTSPIDARNSEAPGTPSRATSLQLGRSDASALVALLIGTLAFFWPMVRPFGGRSYIMAGDFSNQFYPFRWFAAQEWWSGRIPLWNPSIYAGHPFQADVQSAVFYPIALLDAVVMGRGGLPFVALEGEIVVHTFLAAAFMYLLARKVVGSVTGSLVAAVAFGLGGFVTSYPAQQLAILETIAWLPLIVFLIELAVDVPVTWRWLLGASLGFGIAVLAGHPQTDLFIGYLTEGYLLFRLWRARVPLLRSLQALTIFPTVAAGVAAVQILPTLQFFAESARVSMAYEEAAHGYLPSALLQVFVPLWHGEKALSIGVVALVLAGIGAWASRRETMVYWTTAGLIALPLSTGGETALFWVLYHVAPGWNLFRDQERVICVFAFAGALLAARGVAAIEEAAQGASIKRIALAVAAVGAVASFVLLVAAILGQWSDGLRSSLIVDTVVLACLAFFLGAHSRLGKRSTLLSGALILVVAAESFANNQGNNLTPVSPDPRPRLAATATFMRSLPEPFRVKGLSEALFPSDWGTILGTEMITGDTPFTTRRANEMLSGNPDYKVWQLLNLKYFVTDGGPLGGLKPVFHDGALTTYYLEDSLPRAWAVTAVEVARDANEARAMILAPAYHPGNVVVLEQAPALGPIPTGPRPDVRITHVDAQNVTIDANAAQNSMLVLANAYYPDWRAYRDGSPVPIYRANYLTMAFDLPVGQHHYDIVYEPRPFYAGAVLSLACLGLIAVVFARATRRRGPSMTLPTWWSRATPSVLWLASLAIVGGAFALRVHALGAPNLTGDEWFMLRNHDEGPLWIIHQAHTFEPHPLIYYLGLAGWIEVAGRSEFALRFPSVAFGTVLVCALIALGRALIGRRAGLIAGAIGALNPYQLAESQNARNYEMVAAASALASVLFLRAVRTGRTRDWVAYGVAMFAALNVHYDAALVLAAHVAFMVILRAWPAAVSRSRRPPPDPGLTPAIPQAWLRTTATVSILFVAWLVYAWPALAAYHGYFPTPVTIDRVLERSLATFTFGALTSIRVALPAFVLATFALAWLAFHRPARALFLGLYALLPIGAVSLLFLFRPMYDERYLIVLAPGYLVLLAAGIEVLLRRAWPLGVIVGAAILGLTWPAVTQTYASALTDRGDYRSMARWVSTFGAPDDPIVATGHGQAELFGYYFHGLQPVQIVDDPVALGTLPSTVNGHSGLWLLPYGNSIADAAALTSLNGGAAPVAERWFVNVRALYFAMPAQLRSVTPVKASYDGVLDLTGASVPPASVRPGESIATELRWTTTAPMATPKVSLRLVDADGSVVGQSDLPLTADDKLNPGEHVSRIGVFVPPAVPPGHYSIGLVPYRMNDGKALALTTEGARKNGMLILSSVDVTKRDRPLPPEEAGVPLTTPATSPSGLTLLGHDPVETSPVPGDDLNLRILWRQDQEPSKDISRTIELRTPNGQVVSNQTEPIVPAFPTSNWARGEIIAEPVHVRIPAILDTGSYLIGLRVGLASSTIGLGTISVKGPDRSYTEPLLGRPVGVRLGPFAILAREEVVAPSVVPGTSVRLTLVWKALATADRAYTVFVHVLDPSGKIVAQVDRQPSNGARRTDGWAAGEFIQDEFTLQIPPAAAPGPYQVEAGMYDAATGARLPAKTSDGSTSDHVVVATLGTVG